MATFDIAVLGAGPGGYVAAIRAAQYGAKVALVEKADLGGTCLNWGCIPSKALLETVHVFKLLQRAEEYGLACDNPRFDLDAVYDRKDKIVESLRKGVGMLLKKNKVEVIRGHGVLVDRNTLEVSGDDGEPVSVRAEKIILATGTAPMRPDFFPMDEETVVDSDYFLALTEMPESVVVIGGGYIGCEMATVLHGLGAKVTVVEMLPRLLPTADGDVSKEMKKVFKKAKIDLHLDTRVEKIDVTKKGGAKVALSSGETVAADKVLVAIGRTFCTDGLGLADAGVALRDNGTLEVNEHFQTSVPNIYAIGDISGGLQLAHVASRQGLVAAAHATGHHQHVDWKVVPACVFTHPEIGNVGLTEEEAREAGHAVRTARFPFQALGKAMAIGETGGFFKIIADETTGEVLGVHIVGPHASGLIGEAALAMQLECTVEEIAHTIHAHPTLHEGMMECAESWLGMGIHG